MGKNREKLIMPTVSHHDYQQPNSKISKDQTRRFSLFFFRSRTLTRNRMCLPALRSISAWQKPTGNAFVFCPPEDATTIGAREEVPMTQQGFHSPLQKATHSRG
jgi:hypothetical protein